MRTSVRVIVACRSAALGSFRRVAIILGSGILAGVPIALAAPSAVSAASFVEQTEVLGHGAGFGGSGGVGTHSAALSADGNTAIVGAPAGGQGEPGYVFLYHRSGSTWSAPVSLVPEGDTGTEFKDFGKSVALSANGSTALVGVTDASVWAFSLEGAIWHSTRIEVPRETACGERFGVAVALSEDGNTAIIGDPFGCPEDFDGSAWIYTRSGNTWTIQAGPLHGDEMINPFGNADEFGSTVALSGDGNTAIVGASGERGTLGAASGGAWVYKRNGSTWSQDGPKLDPTGAEFDTGFGRSVALSRNGSRALIGTSAEAGEVSSGAWVYDRGPSGWTAHARLASGEENNFYGAFGWAVALSGSGNTALVGGPETRPEEEGQAWAFRCVANEWVRELIPPPVSTKGGEFGYSLSLAGDGATAIVSAPGVSGEKPRIGAAFVFSGPSDPSGSCGGSAGNAGGGSSSVGGPTSILESLRQTHKDWREGRATALLSRRRAPIPVGTTFEFLLKDTARLRFNFAQVKAGRIVRGRCIRTPAHSHELRECRLLISGGSLTVSAHAGRRSLRFDGRITKRHLLPPGSYTLTVTAEAGGKRSAPRHLSFTIVG